VGLRAVTLDTDTSVHPLFGQQIGGGKGYNPKHKGQKRYQPILTFLAKTRAYLSGKLHHGDRPTGAEIARHLKRGFAALPAAGEQILARADSGCYGGDAVRAYQDRGVQFSISARKTARRRGTASGCLEVSRPGESHPEPLAEPYVNVSAHTAPAIERVYNNLCKRSPHQIRRTEKWKSRKNCLTNC